MSAPVQSLVVDTGIAVKWFFEESHCDQALKIRDDFQSGRLHLRAPDRIYAEFANTVWKRVVFFGLDPADGALLIATLQSVPLEIVPSVNLLEKAYLLGVRYKRAIYDSLFLALSLETASAFITGDEKLYNSIRSAFPQVIWIGNWA